MLQLIFGSEIGIFYFFVSLLVIMACFISPPSRSKDCSEVKEDQRTKIVEQWGTIRGYMEQTQYLSSRLDASERGHQREVKHLKDSHGRDIHKMKGEHYRNIENVRCKHRPR